ncbi:prepilin-type N-terminal cleavage/methylation domain-containing protein [Paenibacillus sp. YN15]|uniref:prepilin-type N-terminal cleavage/methylation domain-containing protein n=1 Tax=Paenibacillus sp. YN15 TaxID=1742774 RepID=UPI0011BE3D6F|nr:prepilin-type N-terminal cleavage/methylation domain-containing protein [Paenibacillus sp. YN15]
MRSKSIRPVHHLRKKLADQKGLSLLELLTALLITTMVSTILYCFLLMGVSMYKRIMVETQMRNQGDALYRQIITELKDAVYVEQRSAGGAVPADTSIRYVKRAQSAEDYIDDYVMTLEAGEEDGAIRVYESKDLHKPIKELKMTPDFTISEGSLAAIGKNRVAVNLTYTRSGNEAGYVKADRTKLNINSQITLFRFN